MGGHAHRGQPPRDEAHVAAEVVRGAKVHEPPLDRGLAEEHRGGGRRSGDRLQLRRDEPVLGIPRPGDRAAPRDLDDAVGGAELRGRQRECAILHHEAPCEHRGQDRRAGDHADQDEGEPLAARTEPRAHEAQRVPEAAEGRRHQ